MPSSSYDEPVGASETVLIVEDDSAVRRMYRTALGFAGFDVIEAHDGCRPSTFSIRRTADIVILDLILPTLERPRPCSRRSPPTPARDDIPVVIVTGSDMRLDDSRCRASSASPSRRNDLVAAVRTCLASGAPAPVPESFVVPAPFYRADL